MAPEKAPFTEALKILADLIAEKHLRVLTEKTAATPSPETKPLPGTNIDEHNRAKEK
jgi:hypothetical protein